MNVLQFPTLTREEIEAINFNDFTTEDIYCLIDMGFITNGDVARFYKNQWWDQFSIKQEEL